MSDSPLKSFDGLAERRAARAKLSVLAGGRILSSVPGNENITKDPATGEILPFIVTRFGRPIPSTLERGVGGGEEDQPYIVAMTFVAYAAHLETAEELAAGITRLMLGKQLTNTSTELKAAGGYNYTVLETANKPERFEEGVQFTNIINMGPGPTVAI